MNDIIIVGAGIIGLSTAYALLKQNPNLKITIIEKECKPALHQSSRNSGVIHSGVYYHPNSLKAKNCLEGKKQLISFANQHNIEVKKIGKVITAINSRQFYFLQKLYEGGKANQIGKIKLIDPEELKEIEPYIFAKKAIWIPDVNVISFQKVAEKLAELICKYNVKILFNEQVLNIYSYINEGIVITKSQRYIAKKIINCAGLFSDQFIKTNNEFKIIPFRGEYYEIVSDKKNYVNSLVYPIKDPNLPFLGVHLTKMIDGRLKAGPNALLSFSKEGYRKWDFSLTDTFQTLKYSGFWKMVLRHWRVGLKEISRSYFKSVFLQEIKKIIPSIEKKDLKQSMSGIRAQVVLKNGNLADDFIFQKEKNIFHVINAPSPAATASLSIGNYIANKVLEN